MVDLIFRALFAVPIACLGTLLLMLAAFPLGLVGIFPSDAHGIEVPALYLIIGGSLIWLASFVWQMLTDWDPVIR